MAKILNWAIVEKKIKEKGLSIFTPNDLVMVFGASPVAAGFFVCRNAQKGLLVRLKKSQKGSLYCLAQDMPGRYSIANRVYEPSYISFDSALSFHSIIPETVYAITSATTKPTREFTISGSQFVYHRIKKSVYTGYRPVKHMDDTVLIASPEKAVADYLYFVTLKKRQLNYDRLDLNKVRKNKLIQLARLFNQPSMFDLIRQIYANFRKPTRIY